MGLRWFRCTGLLIAVVIGAMAPTAAAQTGSPSDVGPASLGSGAPDPNLGVAQPGRAARSTSTMAGASSSSTRPTRPTRPASTATPRTPRPPRRRLPRLRLGARHAAARLEHHPAPAARPEQRDRLLPRRPRLVPQDVHAADVDGGQADLDRLRRRLRQLLRLPQRATARQPPVRLHRLQLRHQQARAHRRPDAERARRRRPEPGAEQPLVLRQRHHAPRPPDRDRPDPRRPVGHVRHDAEPGEHDPVGLRRRPRRDAARQRQRRRTQPPRCSTQIRDATGRVVAQLALDAASRCRPAAAPPTRADVRVEHPRLWSTTNPYLYTLQTTVIAGAPPDRLDEHDVRHPLARCSTRARASSLNGQHLKIHGVDLHNDEGALGSVDNYDALWRQMSILKSMGVNAFRTSHNPPSPEMIDVCQRLGIVMMVEAFDAWNAAEAVAGLPPLLQPVERLRHQGDGQRGQELAGGDHVVDRQRDPGLGDGRRRVPIAQRLIADIKSIDTTRPVVAGLGPVPQRAPPRLRRRTDAPAARRPGPQLRHRADDRRAARRVPEHVLLRVRVLLGDLDPRLLPGPEPAQHRAELHAGQDASCPPTTTTSTPGR